MSYRREKLMGNKHWWQVRRAPKNQGLSTIPKAVQFPPSVINITVPGEMSLLGVFRAEVAEGKRGMDTDAEKSSSSNWTWGPTVGRGKKKAWRDWNRKRGKERERHQEVTWKTTMDQRTSWEWELKTRRFSSEDKGLFRSEINHPCNNFNYAGQCTRLTISCPHRT